MFFIAGFSAFMNDNDNKDWEGRRIIVKVVKRDGRVVDYNRNKILIAVRKANAEVDPFERVSEDDIDGIIASVEGVNRETIQVEDIQDMIEQKLMAAGKFILAKT